MSRPSTNDSEITMVLVARKDLKLSPGKLAAQASHAAVNCALTARKLKPTLLEEWRNTGSRKIVCQVNNLEEMKRLYGEARTLGLVSELITDAGRTEIPSGSITILGLGPGPRRLIDALTKELPLL
ncbi:MAG TPA: peptidyl-tRNA hydrolase Pth2 [Candidatus Poseidoniaceae archaeon]|jgi:PTH2 family peptidyl-tRNA hydrolase|nr:peptidyl-tRNA hydrolase Pth2 [Candidatus Poseidoniaceae archaeon]